MPRPLITVLCPVHNAKPYLEAAVNSLFTQTLSDVELLFIDDGSTDGSGEYLEALQRPNMKVIRRNKQGVGAVRNYGLELCKTEYLALMDADDVSMPQRLFSQLAFLQANPECVLLGTQINFLIGKVKQKGLPCATEHEEIVRRLLVGGGVYYPTLVFRTEVAQKIGGFRLKGAGEEFDFCLRMSERGTISNLTEMLYEYRLHRSSISMTKQSDLLRGSAYAKTTFLQRKSGVQETSFDEFGRLWEKRVITEVLSERIKTASNMSYRLGRINVAEGRRALGVLQMAFAASLGPTVTFTHLRRIAARLMA